MMHVNLAWELRNPKDENSIVIITQSSQVLGHLERKVATVLTPIMDLLLVCSYHLQEMHSSNKLSMGKPLIEKPPHLSICRE